MERFSRSWLAFGATALPERAAKRAVLFVLAEAESSAVVRLQKQYLLEMIAHAREEAPLEACGILAGKAGRVVKLYRARNADRSPVSYRLEPEQQYRIFRNIEEKGWDIMGIYHSHPASPPVPSPRDLKQAYYPDAVYFVVSLADPEEPEVRAFRIAQGEVAEEEMAIG